MDTQDAVDESEIELSGDDDEEPVMNRIRPTQTGMVLCYYGSPLLIGCLTKES